MPARKNQFKIIFCEKISQCRKLVVPYFYTLRRTIAHAYTLRKAIAYPNTCIPIETLALPISIHLLGSIS